MKAEAVRRSSQAEPAHARPRRGNAAQTRDRRDSRWDDHRRERRRDNWSTPPSPRWAGTAPGVGHGRDRRRGGDEQDRRLPALRRPRRAARRRLQPGGLPAAAEAAGRDARAAATRARWSPRPSTRTWRSSRPTRSCTGSSSTSRPDRPASDPISTLSDLVGEQASAVIAVALQQAGSDPAAAGPWGHGVVGLVRSAADWWLRAERPMLRSRAHRAPDRSRLGRPVRRRGNRIPEQGGTVTTQPAGLGRPEGAPGGSGRPLGPRAPRRPGEPPRPRLPAGLRRIDAGRPRPGDPRGEEAGRLRPGRPRLPRRSTAARTTPAARSPRSRCSRSATSR